MRLSSRGVPVPEIVYILVRGAPLYIRDGGFFERSTQAVCKRI